MGLLGGIVSAIGGPIVGGILGNKSANKASKKAAAIAAETSRQNNALFRETRDLNTANLSPFMERGNIAGDYYNAMLGLPSTQSDAPQPAAPTPTITSPTSLNALIASFDPRRAGQTQPISPSVTQTITPASNRPAVSQSDAQGAFGSFIENSDYGFQFGEGSNALNSGYAAQGSLESGAAMKALERYRQNLQSGYRGEYMGYLGNQQGMGMSGASALAGVGNTFASSTAQSNTSAGQAAANAALQIGGNNSSFYNAMGSLVPKMASSFMGGGMG